MASSRVGLDELANESRAERFTHVTINPKIPTGSSAHFCRMGTEKATVLPVPVRDPPMQSRPFKISGIHAAWIPVGFLISMDARDATSHGATSMEAKLSFSLLGGRAAGTGEAAVEAWCFALILEMVETGMRVCAGSVSDSAPCSISGSAFGDSLLLFLDPAWCCRMSSSDALKSESSRAMFYFVLSCLIDCCRFSWVIC
jgi:hypothetical protein